MLGLAGLGFEGVWVSPGPLLGTSWAVLGTSWAPLGASRVLLGRLLGALGHLLGASSLSWAPLGLFLEGLKRPRMGFGGLRGGFWYAFGVQSLALHNALIAAENPLWHLLGFSFSPCSAAARAQHIRRLPKGEPSVPNSSAFISQCACLRGLLQMQSLKCLKCLPPSFY